MSHRARSIALVYAAILLAVLGIGLILHSQTLNDPNEVMDGKFAAPR